MLFNENTFSKVQLTFRIKWQRNSMKTNCKYGYILINKKS